VAEGSSARGPLRTAAGRIDEGAPVGLGEYPTVERGHHAAVGLRPDEAAEPLAEAQDGLRERVFIERIFVALGACGDDRIRGHVEGEADDGEHGEGLPRDVDPFPERVPMSTAWSDVRKLSRRA
jgi:hypothetical protein